VEFRQEGVRGGGTKEKRSGRNDLKNAMKARDEEKKTHHKKKNYPPKKKKNQKNPKKKTGGRG